jgi:3-oxoacyl-[acyl-carrier protein] reductase
MTDFAGKRALITGAGRGLGRQFAVDFAAAGARVAVNYSRSAAAAEEEVAEIAAAGGEAFCVGADITRSDQVAAMFEEIVQRIGGLDILINNAGLSRDGPVLEMTEEDWDAVISVNLKGPFLCSQYAGRMMTAEGCSGGRIINISGTSSIAGRKNCANYASSKAGLNALTRCLAFELGPQVTVNAVDLGFFDSPLVRELFSPEQVAAAVETMPVGRIGQFKEASGFIRYLASDAAAFMTGQTVNFDGGQIMR